MPAFNAANVSQDLKYDLFIFEKYKDSLTKLKYIILPISYFSLWGELEESLEDWRVRKYQIYMDDHRYPFYKLRYNFEFAQLGNRELLLYHLHRKQGCDCLPCGMGTSYFMKFRSKDWKLTGCDAVERHTVFGKIDSLTQVQRLKNNICYLTSIVKECKKRNVKVLIITMPAFRSYYEKLNLNQLEQMYVLIDDVVSKEGCQYLDLLKDSRFGEDDFYDADHLNEYGARKVSDILNKYFISNDLY